MNSYKIIYSPRFSAGVRGDDSPEAQCFQMTARLDIHPIRDDVPTTAPKSHAPFQLRLWYEREMRWHFDARRLIDDFVFHDRRLGDNPEVATSFWRGGDITEEEAIYVEDYYGFRNGFLAKGLEIKTTCGYRLIIESGSTIDALNRAKFITLVALLLYFKVEGAPKATTKAVDFEYRRVVHLLAPELDIEIEGISNEYFFPVYKGMTKAC